MKINRSYATNKKRRKIFMESFRFVSHNSYPLDTHTKEVVILSFPGEKGDFKYRVAYARKVASKTGGLFWDVASVGVTVEEGKKQYINGFAVDSTFLNSDIKEYLEKRKWMNTFSVQPSYVAQSAPFVPEPHPEPFAYQTECGF